MAAALQRHWRLIAKVAGGALALSALYALITPRVWEGEFQIVLASGDSGGGRLAQLAAANPMLANLAGVGGGGSKDSLETEVKVLESPSVLKPVFDFVRTSKQRAGQNTDGMRFSDFYASCPRCTPSRAATRKPFRCSRARRSTRRDTGFTTSRISRRSTLARARASYR